MWSASNSYKEDANMDSSQTIQWHSLDFVTWAFHVAVGHLEGAHGTMLERLSFRHQAVVDAQTKLLRLPGSLTQELRQLLNDLKAGHCDEYPLEGNAAVRKYYEAYGRRCWMGCPDLCFLSATIQPRTCPTITKAIVAGTAPDK
jgi:hypothetical protein